MGGSDGESSGSEGARPLFRPLTSGPAAGAGKSAKLHRSLDNFLDANALPDAASSDEDKEPTRQVVASHQLSEEKDSKGGALAKLNKRLRKKKDAAANGEGASADANPRAKRAKARLERMELADPTEDPSVEDTMAFLEQMEFDGAAGDEASKEAGGTSRSKRAKTGTLLKRKPATKGGQIQVRMESKKGSPANKASPGSASKDSDEITPAKEARLRIKEKGGKGAGKAKKEEGDGLGSESEDDEDTSQVEAWEADLKSRCEKEHSEVIATAFSIKPCPVSAIRQLPASSFLGRRRLEEGGHLLMDTSGCVNLHFMLGTYKNLQKLRERSRRGDKTATPADKADIKYLRWLIIKALKLRVINKRELQSGKVNQGRTKTAEKNLRWSLSRKVNLAEHSDNEGADEVSPELVFKGKEQTLTEAFKAVRKEGRTNFRTQIVKKQAEVNVSSSHNINMEEMQNRLTAPSLSFDWEEKGSESEEDMLKVDMPEEESKNSKRNLFKDQLQRSASFHMAKGLTHRPRTTANLSRSFSAVKLGGSAPAPAETPRALPATVQSEAQASPDAKMTGPGEAGASSAVPGSSVEKTESKLWEVLHEPSTSVEDSAKPEQPQAVAAEGSVTSAQLSTADESKDIGPEEQLEKLFNAPRTVDPATSSQAPISTREPLDPPLSQDWHGITPTAMWTAKAADSRDSFDSMGGAEDKSVAQSSEGKHADISPTAAFVPSKAPDENFDISPTMPFVPKAMADISPTMPFVPTKATDDQPDISPTAPFVPVAISQTQPFVASEPPASKKDIDSIAPQMEATLMPEAAALSLAPQARKAPGNGALEKQISGRRLQRSTSLISEDSLSASESEDEEGLGAEELQENSKRRKREREWLKHNRRAARQEAKEATSSVKSRKLNSQEVGVSLLSAEERSRWESVVDTVKVKANNANSRQAAPMLQGNDASQEEDVFGSFGRAPGGIIKKKSFLMK